MSESEKSEFPFYDNGEEDISLRRDEPDIMNGYCTNCGHSVSMSNNFMLSDYDDTITDDNDDKMNFVLGQCPYCGMYEVRWDTAENDKKNFPYWNEDDNEPETTDTVQLAKEIVEDFNKKGESSNDIG